ncbi:hypothetical protein [Catellatospora coxensis]|uniref:Uncharacterized protein n=1 Tax=Catellatospora coxensis TaxID=310354 RepID=A0A8J3L5W7_9ACTN|nr:hypothetical protein [Catellatospora coxensis]GIG08425.1 hypothetical protein Cco03nite_51250 [Catellatospora coxensis]
MKSLTTLALSATAALAVAAVATPALGASGLPSVTPVSAARAMAALTPTSVTWTTANSTATGDQDVSAVATNRSGHVAVVWEDDRDSTGPEDAAHSEIFLRLFRDGVAVYELKLSAGGTAGTTWRHLSPDVGLDDKGNAVVVWADDPDGNGFYNIPYRVVSPTGTILGSGNANASAAGQQINPAVAVDPDGTPSSSSAVAFTVVWEDVQDPNPATVKAAGFTNVTTKAYEVTASQTTGAHHRPDVAVSAAGDAVVVWNEDGDGNGFDNIGLVRLAKANGAVTLSRRTANATGDGQQRNASVAANMTGEFTVAWESDHTGAPTVWTRSFTSAGTARHADVEVSPQPGATAPSTGIDDQANVVVAWSIPANTGDVWARGVNPDGTTAGRLPAQFYSDLTTGRQDQPAVAVSPWGEIALTFTDDNDGNQFDQIRLGLGAPNSDW